MDHPIESLYERYKRSRLTQKDIDMLVRHSDLFKKFIDMYIVNFQSDISSLKYWGKEAEIYMSVKILNQLKEKIDQTVKGREDYKKSKEKRITLDPEKKNLEK